MKSSAHQIDDLLQILRKEVETLGRFYVIVQRLSETLDDAEETSARGLHVVHEAAWRSLLIGLAGLLSNDQESITLSYLLDLANNHPHSFKYSEQQAVTEVIKLGREKLAEIDRVEQKLRVERDRRLAHLDRKLINESELFGEAFVELNDAFTALSTTERIVSELYRAFYGKKIHFSEQRDLFTFQFEHVLMMEGI
jgi:hypothetical protein